MITAANIKITQCPLCNRAFAQHKNTGRYKTCPKCRTPAALAAFGYGHEDIVVMTGISREEARAIVFGREAGVMSEAKHTSTPWGLCAHLANHDECPCGYRGAIWSADGETIVCEMGSSPDHDGAGKIMGHTQPQADRPTQLADAAFIVRAVNAHDDLVAACRDALDALEGLAANRDTNLWCKQLRAALAKAEAS
jgi:hypothetical protein